MTYITDKKKWYTEQITACQASLYRLAVSLLRDEEDARDALQEALCAGYEKLGALRDPDKFRPWIIRILHNAAYDILRQRKPSVSLSDIPPIPSSLPKLIRLWTPIFFLRGVYLVTTGLSARSASSSWGTGGHSGISE